MTPVTHKSNFIIRPTCTPKQMYVEDYVLWCQSLSDKWVEKCLESLQSCIHTLTKEHIGLDIDKLELYAKNILENQSEDVSTEVDLLQKIADLQINEDNVDSDDSYDESDSSSSDSAESSSDSEAETDENNTSKEVLCQITDKSSILGATVNTEDVVK